MRHPAKPQTAHADLRYAATRRVSFVATSAAAFLHGSGLNQAAHARPGLRIEVTAMTTTRAEIERKLDQRRTELEAIPDRGFDSSRRRAEVQDDIDALLERLYETL